MKKLLTAIILLLPAVVQAQLKTAGLFGDNAVVQQGKPIPVWGWARPGAEVRVSLGQAGLVTFADQRGGWKVLFPPMVADGKDYALAVESGDEKDLFTNIKVGEVWFASGQSNMAYRVGDGVLDQEKEIAQAIYPDIRYLDVGQSPAAEPLADIPNRAWQQVTPKNAGAMSAVSYFFARDLFLDRKVPVGVIVAARGATQIATWISSEMLATDSLYRDLISGFSPSEWKSRKLAAERDQWLRDSIERYALSGLALGVEKTGYDDSGWGSAEFPIGLRQLIDREFWGVIWFRKHFTLTGRQSRNSWTLVLPVTDVGNIQYVNGREVGRKKSALPEVLEIRVPALKSGDNVLALRMVTTWGLCNIGNRNDGECYLVSESGERIDLRGAWLYDYRIEPEMPKLSRYYNEPAVNFNGMVAPCAGYGIRGFLWYQGEGNTGYYPGRYGDAMRMLVEDWRIRWGQGYLPFLYVQLAGMNPHSKTPLAHDDWAVLRDRQTAVMTGVPATAMASAIDAGEWNNVHPKNKQAVGARLYLAARANVYGDSIEWSGPVMRDIVRENGGLTITYSHAGSGLATNDGKPVRAFAVRDALGKWHWAEARIDGCRIRLDGDAAARAKAAQYAWQANPEANLCNAQGLPAVPFNVPVK